MKMKCLLFPFFLFLLAENGWAQTSLTCTNCKVGNNPAVTGTDTCPISTTPETPIVDNIVLSSQATAVFTITGSGNIL